MPKFKAFFVVAEANLQKWRAAPAARLIASESELSELCERLYARNYRVFAEVYGSQDENRYLIDVSRVQYFQRSRITEYFVYFIYGSYTSTTFALDLPAGNS